MESALQPGEPLEATIHRCLTNHFGGAHPKFEDIRQDVLLGLLATDRPILVAQALRHEKGFVGMIDMMVQRYRQRSRRADRNQHARPVRAQEERRRRVSTDRIIVIEESYRTADSERDLGLDTEDAIQQLDADGQAWLRLYYWESLTFEEIAQRTGRPLLTVYRRIRSARDRLRNLLTSSGYVTESP